MAAALRVCLCVCVFTASQGTLGLPEGNDCKQDDGVSRSCKLLDDCPRAQEGLKRGEKPTPCSSKGADPGVCCEAQGKMAIGDKSREMCKKYAEGVFVTKPSPIPGEGPVAVDTCVVEPLLITDYVYPREYPHMALIGYGERSAISWLCTGSLISERFVLTSASCALDNPRWGPARWVRLGEYNVSSTEDEASGVSQSAEYEIAARIVHPGHRRRALHDDIALLRLARDANMTEHVRPTCLPTDADVRLNSNLYAVDWELHENKKSGVAVEYRVNVTSSQACSEAFQGVRGPSSGEVKEEAQLCAGSGSHQRHPCMGDSGAPLQARLKDPYCTYSLVGVTSLGPWDCTPRMPGLYTRVSHYLPWIESVVWPDAVSAH